MIPSKKTYFKMFPELISSEVVNVFNFAVFATGKKKKSISSELFCSQKLPHILYEKIQNHNHSEACGWARSKNLLICEDTVSEMLSCCIRRWKETTNRLDVSPENLIMTIPNDNYHVFILYSRKTDIFKSAFWRQQGIFSYGYSFILLFTDTFQ